MYDDIPSPFGDVTRRWTHLTDQERDGHAFRLLSRCPTADVAHFERPQLDDGVCYAEVVEAAAAGDLIALAWLASSHCPILLVRGRALYEDDPSEWGLVCLEALHRVLARVDVGIGRWLRRRVVQHTCRQVSRTVERHLARRDREVATDPVLLGDSGRDIEVEFEDEDLDLAIAIDEALTDLSPATRDAFLALASDEPLSTVADWHHLPTGAIRNRVWRARSKLQPQLAGFVREVDR